MTLPSLWHSFWYSHLRHCCVLRLIYCNKIDITQRDGFHQISGLAWNRTRTSAAKKRQCTNNVTLMRIHAIIVAVEKQ
jgi:hypothetical protein